MGYNYIYKGQKLDSNIIGYVEFNGLVYSGRPDSGHVVGKLDSDGILLAGSPGEGWRQVGKIDAEGYVYNTWNPDTYRYPTPFINPACIGKYENGLFYSAASPAFGSQSSFAGMSDSAYAGTTERGGYEAGGAALLLLMDTPAGGNEYGGGTATGAVDSQTFRTVMLYSLFIIAMLATVIVLKAPGTIVAAVEALAFIIAENMKAGKSLKKRKIEPRSIGKAAVTGVIYIILAALVLVIIHDQSPYSDFYLIAGGIIVGASDILDGLFSDK